MRTKTIVINTHKDYIKFIKKIKYYKSLIYYKTYFKSINNLENKNVEAICEGLNIKNRKERITYTYDKACDIVDSQNKGINICGFKNNKCYVQRKLNNNKCNGCCRGCLYQTNKGCSTKNLTCKLFNCSEVKKRFKTLEYKDLDILKLLSLKNRHIIKSDYFSTREEVLKDLYSISMIYSALRILYRMLRNIVLLKLRHKKTYK